LISRIFNLPKAKLAIGGNTFIIGLIVGIELPFIGTSKNKKKKLKLKSI
jgi:predicted membrane-bound spermidine synthase